MSLTNQKYQPIQIAFLRHISKGMKMFELRTRKGAYNRRKNTNETVQQFYKGIKVENAIYSIHY